MKKLLLLSFTLLATGCSLDASLENIVSRSDEGTSIPPAAITGIAVGSVPMATAPGGYAVYSAVDGKGGTMASTLDGSYKVYSTLQGALVSHLAQ